MQSSTLETWELLARQLHVPPEQVFDYLHGEVFYRALTLAIVGGALALLSVFFFRWAAFYNRKVERLPLDSRAGAILDSIINIVLAIGTLILAIVLIVLNTPILFSAKGVALTRLAELLKALQ